MSQAWRRSTDRHTTRGLNALGATEISRPLLGKGSCAIRPEVKPLVTGTTMFWWQWLGHERNALSDK